MYDVDKQRRTGRTTRMLEEAIRLSSKGHAVYVMGRDPRHAEELQLALEDLNPPEYHGIKFETVESLPHFDWRRMCLARAHPNCRVLVDHWVIESRYAALLEILHQFDKV
jgi:hypothetical protein